MTQHRKLLFGAILAAAFLVGAVQPAGASLVLTLGVTNLGGFSAPFGTVTVDLLDTTHAQISYASSIVAGNIYLFGDGGCMGVNINAASWTLGTVTGSNAGTGFTPGPFSDGGTGSEDGFGSFNQTVNDFDGFSHSVDNASFIVTNTSGSWADVGHVLTPNGDGYMAAAHIFVTTYPANSANGAIITGFAANGETPPPVPEPVSLFTLGSGLLGIGLLQFRRRKKA